MIKFENTEVTGWEAAIRGMRNPMNSWDKIDSYVVAVPESDRGYGTKDSFKKVDTVPAHFEVKHIVQEKALVLGENDLKLMRNLAKAGTDHAKFTRMIIVTVDITAPLYWWKEFDTYKVGTVANSCSTMHKIAAKEFTIEDFSHEHIIEPDSNLYLATLDAVIDTLNTARSLYIETKDKIYWWQMIQLLPTSYNQLRTVQMSYQSISNMYFSRRNHKLDCWREFCKWVETLPYFKEIYLDGMD